MISISYAITVCNELEEIIKLLDFLQLHIRPEDEVVIQYDSSSATQEVKEYLNVMDMMRDNHKVISFPLNNDFATFKNNLKSYCTKDYIFQIDADEIPHEALIEYLPEVLELNPVDVVFVPRINTVEGLTPSHIQKWGWNVNDKGWVNFPDYQLRIYKRTDDVVWMNKVHETITGYTTFSNFPMEEHWCLYHPKEIQRQEKQNDYYETIQR
jgi:glycosyltransferase involved in cell wall biosynthesis